MGSRISIRTFSARPQDVQHDWYVIDASDKVLGRLATYIAVRLRGKHKPVYTPHVDTGDYIIVTNAHKIRVTGKKMTDKIYYHHSGYPGGIKSVPFSRMLEKHPSRILELAVKRMLPRGPLGRQMFKKLKVYADATHPHTAQNPQVLAFDRDNKEDKA